jgi:hypothetical protein
MGEFRTDYLFARPSFWEGIARIFDFGSTLNEYNFIEDGAEADRIALANDWAIVCNDIRKVIGEF